MDSSRCTCGVTWTTTDLPEWGRAGREQPVAQARGRRSLFYEPIRSRMAASRRIELLTEMAGLDDPMLAVDEIVIILRTSRTALRIDSGQLSDFCTYDLEPLRRPVSFKRDKKQTALYSFVSPLGVYAVWAESGQESAHLTDLIWRSNPVFLATQALSFNFCFAGLWLEHVPDLVAEHSDGTRVVVDVHGTWNGKDSLDFVIKARLTRALLESLGFGYLVLGAISRQRSLNLVHLRRYARTSERVRRLAGRLDGPTFTAHSINGFVAQQQRIGVPRELALASTMRALWSRTLWVDLDKPLRGHSQVRRQPNPSDLQVPGLRVEGEGGWVVESRESTSYN